MNHRGLTLIEVMISSMIVAMIALASVRLLKIPFILQGWISQSGVEAQAHPALDRMVKDLKEGIPNSVHWTESATPAALRFGKARLVKNSSQKTDILEVGYIFGATESSGEGVLYRVEGGSPTVVLSHILPPSPDQPLFTLDPELHIITVSLRMRPPGRPEERFVRRVAMVH
jgi:prepilin-type N-terminal cleavage/methylation domain-containing protein